MPGVAVGSISGSEQVALLRARRQARRRPHPLNVEQYRRYLGKVGEPQELGHQRKAGAAGRSERARAVPGGADDDADGRQFVFRLNHRELPLAGIFVDAQPRRVILERFRHRCRRCDRIPGADRGTRIDRPQCPGFVAVDHDPVADEIGATSLNGQWALQVLAGVVAAHLEGANVRGDEFVLAPVLRRDHPRDDVEIDVQQRRQGAHVDDVLEQLALPRIRVGGHDQLGDRHTYLVHVAPEQAPVEAGGVIVEQVSPGDDGGNILLVGLGVHGDHQVDAFAAAVIARRGCANLEPRRQTFNVRRENVVRGDRYAHAEERFREHAVGAGRTGAVDVGETDDEVVVGSHSGYVPSWGTWITDFCMSHAAVGQRSAHNPQCRQTSSSFTITRPVPSSPDT